MDPCMRRSSHAQASIFHLRPTERTPCYCMEWQHPPSTKEDPLHKAIVGRLTYEASVMGWWSAMRAVTTKGSGSLKAAWIWWVQVPGVKPPAIRVVPVACVNFSTASWPVFLEEMKLASGGFSTARMAWTVNNFFHVLFRFMMKITILFHLSDRLLHVEVKVATMKVGFCGKECEDIRLHLQDIKDSSHYIPFKLWW